MNEPTAGPDPDEFRRAMGRFATGVAIMTTRHDNLDYAMTVNSLTSVSLDPMLVLACVEVDSRFHDAVIASGTWGMSILAASERATSNWFATRGRPMHGQFGQFPHTRVEPTGVLLMDRSITGLQCRTQAVHPGGDHSILVGAVVDVVLPSRPGAALLYYRGGYGRIE